MDDNQKTADALRVDDRGHAASGLRAVVPHVIGGADSAKLEREVSRHRVLIVRTTAVIAVTTLISVGGALFIHAMFAGVFIFGLFFNWGLAALPAGTSGKSADAGGADGEIMVIHDSPNAGDPTRPARPAGTQLPNVLAALPLAALPALPEATPVQLALAPPMQTPDVPIAPPQDLGTVKVPVPANLVKQPTPEGLVVSAPASAEAATAASPAGRTSAAALATGTDFGDDEPVLRIYKDGTGGSGGGSGPARGRGLGSGRGTGIDRGASGADRPEPVVLDNPQPDQTPAWFQYNPPKQAVTLSVMVMENGAVGDITIVASSGRPEVDAYYRNVLAGWKYSPAVVGGRRVARAKEISFDPRI